MCRHAARSARGSHAAVGGARCVAGVHQRLRGDGCAPLSRLCVCERPSSARRGLARSGDGCWLPLCGLSAACARAAPRGHGRPGRSLRARRALRQLQVPAASVPGASACPRLCLPSALCGLLTCLAVAAATPSYHLRMLPDVRGSLEPGALPVCRELQARHATCALAGC